MNNENYIVINGKRAELTEEQLNSLCMFKRFAQMAKEQFGLTITQKKKKLRVKRLKTLFGTEVEPERNNPFSRVDKLKQYHFIGNSDSIYYVREKIVMTQTNYILIMQIILMIKTLPIK